MNTLAFILILVLLAGIGCVFAALGKLWAVSGGIDDPVGSRLPRSKSPTPPALLPGEFRSLVNGEASQWKLTHQWEQLTQSLDQLEVEFGGAPFTPAPPSYSAEWLDHRIARIEALAGPMPEPLRPVTQPNERRRLWKRTGQKES